MTPIRPDYVPHARAERLIASGRFVLAFSSLVAVYLEPSTPARFQRATYSLLLIYTIYALVMALYAWRSPVPSARWRLASHVLDLVLFSVFIYLTEGPASPFFLYFIFSLFCATLRFSGRGVLATGIAAIAIYGVMAFIASVSDPAFDASRVLIREAYLAVIAALVFYLGVHHHRLRGEMASLAAWPRELAGGVEDVLRAGLAHAASVVNARRVLLVWEESEEPWIHVASSVDGRLTLERVAPGAFAMPAAEDPRNIVVALETQSLAMHFIIPDVKSATADDLALANIVARLLLATLEQYFFVQQVRQTASAEERLRISRELHDGIVQSLGGVGLQLQAMRTQLANAEAAERLAHVQRVIEHDQRELRTLVRELRPHDARDGAAILADELQRMRERYALEWGLEVIADARTERDVPARLAHELCRILNESLANAARHGGATRAEIDVRTNDGQLQLRVADNGRGFPFTGRHELDALRRNGNGPRTLKERVIALDGSLAIESASTGAVIEVTLPVGEAR